MQSTGQVSIASWILSVLSPSWRIARDRPQLGSTMKVFVATWAQ
jgi:hypothetical protein